MKRVDATRWQPLPESRAAPCETPAAGLAHVLIALLGAVALGCPGDGSGGRSPQIRFNDTPECIVFAGGFPSGFARLSGDVNHAAVAQFAPPAILGLDLEREPPRLLAEESIPGWPELASPRCGGVRVDSDADGRADADRSDALGFNCLTPAAGNLRALSPGRVGLVTSGYEQVLLIEPESGRLQSVELATPPASSGFDPSDWPFWPAPGVRPYQSGFSTRVCVYGDDFEDSLGDPIGPNPRCDATRAGFVTSFTADLLRLEDRLFVVTSNLIRSSRAQFAPGTLLVFDYDERTTPPRVAPAIDAAVYPTTGFNPTTLTPYTTPTGRRLVLVGVSGAIALGTGSDLVRSDSAIDVFAVAEQRFIATIPLGRAGLGFSHLAIDPSGRLGLIGGATSRALFAIDLAALDDPTLGVGAGGASGSPSAAATIPLDGSVPGTRDARVFDGARPFVLPRRGGGPSDAVCTTQTSVAIQAQGDFAAATDFCDGTIVLLDLGLPSDRATPIDPDRVLQLERMIAAAAPLVDEASGQIRAIDRILLRETPAADRFGGPEIHFTAGLPEGAVCGIRLE